MNTQQILDAIIIGGGPAGSTAAILLAKAGWSVALVEKKAFPRAKVCGEYISSTTFPLLQQLDLADFYLKNSGPEIKRVGLYVRKHKIFAEMPKSESSGIWGRAIGRDRLDTELLASAVKIGVQVWQPWKATDVQCLDDVVFCVIQTKEQLHTLKSRMVIMAQGSWEHDISSPDNHFKAPKNSDLFGFKAHFNHSSLADDLMPLLLFPGGYGGLVGSDHGRTSLSCCISREMLTQLREKYPHISAGACVLNHIKESCLGVREVLESAEQLKSWLAVGPIRPGIRHHFKKNIFYIGNIAGESHPIIAEGISMAMQSGWMLSHNLLNHKNLIEAGENYRRQWRKQFALRLHVATIFAKMAKCDHFISFCLPFIEKFPRLLTIGASLSGKKKSNYLRGI